MVELSIQSDIEKIEEALREVKAYIPGIQKKILKKITSKGKTKLRKAYMKSGLNTRTGKLYKAIYGSAKNDSIGYFGVLSKQKYRVLTLNYGATLYPKRNSYMRFQVNGNWVRVKSVKIEPHEFLSAMTNYANSEEFNKDMFSVVDKELDKLMRL